MMPPHLLSRKFLLAFASLISLDILMWFHHISDGVYSAGLVVTVGAYLAANVLQKKGTPP